jgi:bifunctional non-homologous end joining protein LigD
MLASTRPLPADPSGWAFEPKWDGLRCIGAVEAGVVRLVSRNGRELSSDYPELHDLGSCFGPTQALVDGEIIAFDADGRPDFGSRQPRMHVSDEAAARQRAATDPVTYVVFDLLQLDGRSLRDLPYDARRRLLVQLDLHGPHLATSPSWTDAGLDTVLRATAGLGLEGIVAKRRSSRYEPGTRSPSWRKVKHHAGQEVVVGGWTAGRGERTGELGALLVGVHDGDDLVYAGRVGTGFDRAERVRLLATLTALEQGESPFAGPVRFDGEIHWARPEVVVQVEFSEWTASGHLRQPSYRGIRTDKSAEEVIRER